MTRTLTRHLSWKMARPHLGIVHLFDGEPLEVHADLLPNLHELLDWLGPGVVRVRLDRKAEALLSIYIHLACTVLDGINKKFKALEDGRDCEIC
jgi:hypothetical protein